jgi:hypothetical protein
MMTAERRLPSYDYNHGSRVTDAPGYFVAVARGFRERFV